MKTFRDLIVRAEKRHHEQRYPGDLAADLGLDDSVAGRLFAWPKVAAVAAMFLFAGSVWWLASRSVTSPQPTPGPIAVIPVPDTTPDPDTQPVPIPETTTVANTNATGTATTAVSTLDPNTVGVRLSETPRLRTTDFNQRPSRVTPPQRPNSLSLSSTPRRFPGVKRSRNEPSPPSSRRPHNETLPADLT